MGDVAPQALVDAFALPIQIVNQYVEEQLMCEVQPDFGRVVLWLVIKGVIDVNKVGNSPTYGKCFHPTKEWDLGEIKVEKICGTPNNDLDGVLLSYLGKKNDRGASMTIFTTASEGEVQNWLSRNVSPSHLSKVELSRWGLTSISCGPNKWNEYFRPRG